MCGSMNAITIKPSEPVELHSQILLGFCDISGSGVRALASLQHTSNVAELLVEGLPESMTLTPVFTNLPPFSVRTIVSSAGKVSVFLLNSTIPARCHASFTKSLLSYLQSTSQAVHITIVAAAVLNAEKLQGLCTVQVNSPNTPSSIAPLHKLPASTRVLDPLLATFLHACLASGIPALCLLTPGYKPSAVSLDDANLQQVSELLTGLEAGWKLSGSQQLAAALRPSRNWNDVERESCDLMYM